MEIKRGDVWYYRANDAVGYEEFVGRPMVVVSNDIFNATTPLVVGVYTTSKPKNNKTSPKLNSMGTSSWAVCNQIVTVDKSRLDKRIGTLSYSDMERVDIAMRVVLSLPGGGTAAEKNVTELEKKVEELETECEIQRRAYNRVLDRLIDIKIEKDMSAAKPESEPESLMKPFYVEPVEPEEDVGPVDLNTCSEDDLKRLGFKPEVIQNIIAFRPFKKKDDLRVVPGVTKVAWQIVQHKVEVGSVVEEKPAEVVAEPEEPKVAEEKVNVNTATAKELMAVGIGATAAYSITGYRNKHGRYLCLDDLANVKQFSKKSLERLRDKLCV